MYCRTSKIRKEIVKNYCLLPFEHNVIINGVTLKSDAGDKLENEYYKFLLLKDNKFVDTIICGNFVAKDFANMIHKKLPPLFSIFKNNVVINNTECYLMDSVENNDIIWNNKNKQLYNAIRIFLMYYNPNPYTTIYKIYFNVLKNKNIFNIKNLLSFNTILQKYQTRLTEILYDIKNNNSEKELRNFDFSLLTKELRMKNINVRI